MIVTLEMAVCVFICECVMLYVIQVGYKMILIIIMLTIWLALVNTINCYYFSLDACIFYSSSIWFEIWLW